MFLGKKSGTIGEYLKGNWRLLVRNSSVESDLLYHEKEKPKCIVVLTYPYFVFPLCSRASTADAWVLVSSSQLLSLSKMDGSEFSMYDPSRVQHMFPITDMFSSVKLVLVIPLENFKKVGAEINFRSEN